MPMSRTNSMLMSKTKWAPNLRTAFLLYSCVCVGVSTHAGILPTTRLGVSKVAR
jgi:hypothetical protein